MNSSFIYKQTAHYKRKRISDPFRQDQYSKSPTNYAGISQLVEI